MPCEHCVDYAKVRFCGECGEKITKIDVAEALRREIDVSNVFIALINKKRMVARRTMRIRELPPGTTAKIIPRVSRMYRSEAIGDQILDLIETAKLRENMCYLAYSGYIVRKENDMQHIIFEESCESIKIEEEIKSIFRNAKDLYINLQLGRRVYTREHIKTNEGRIIKMMGGKLEDYYKIETVIDGTKIWQRNDDLAEECDRVNDMMNAIKKITNRAKVEGDPSSSFEFFRRLFDLTSK
jgi:hypothetical protein